MPWYAWAYLGLLCVTAAGRFTFESRAGHPWLALLRMAAVFVLGLGVVLYYRGNGAGMLFALGLALAIAVQAHKTRSDTQAMQRSNIAPSSRLGVVLNDLVMVPAAIYGAVAFWMQRGG